MTSTHRKRLIFHWTTPKSLLTIILFVTLTIIIEYSIITLTTAAADLAATTILLFNVPINPVYHLLPSAVIITLTACFTHLTTQTAVFPKRAQLLQSLPPRKIRLKPQRLKVLRRVYEKFTTSARKIKDQILRTSALTQVQRRVLLTKTIIRSAATIVTTFIILVLLITLAAYPYPIPTAALAVYNWNKSFLNFVAGTMEASNAIANALSPLGAVAGAIQNALIAASPAFHTTIDGFASAITLGLAPLSSIEKFVLIQNVAAWTIATATLIYSQYTKTRRYRR
ncbi:MAG: hypothetical protein JSW72_06190 [Candidatus Bathyarchaeota archaeon]|nr:MAG: hypothetical protein JSW72_06190 [Candidatus Bathyarchaeota archaeon]